MNSLLFMKYGVIIQEGTKIRYVQKTYVNCAKIIMPCEVWNYRLSFVGFVIDQREYDCPCYVYKLLHVVVHVYT